jgi:hypothetical protein
VKVEVLVDERNAQLAYEAPDDIAIGDVVIVPVRSFFDGRDDLCTGTVVSLETDYDGYCRSVHRVVKVPPAEQTA